MKHIRNRQHLAACVATLLLAACASHAPVVQTEQAPGFDPGKYHTYTWVEEPQIQSPITRDKYIRAVDAQLSAKGWQRVPDAGDVALVGHLETREEVSYSHFSLGVGLGGWGNNGGAGVGTSAGTSVPKTNVVGTLVIDLYDAKTKYALWRGSATSDVPQTAEKVDAAIAATIPQMFAKFPHK